MMGRLAKHIALWVAAVFAVPTTISAAAPVAALHAREASADPTRIDSVVVAARRALREVGVQKTALDTLALRDNVTMSMADVLSQSSTVFIKSYGRATLSTASFRGTAPSQTVVTWNGMRIDSPMLGMVDFSTIPSYLVDNALLYFGASSVALTGGGLGGAVALQSNVKPPAGFSMRYIQGISSFRTFDEFLQLGYARGRWQATTRAALSTSANDFPYINYHKKDFTYDANGNITGLGGPPYPTERNRDGGFRDLHIMQQIGYDSPALGQWNLAAWYFGSSRGLPMLSVSYRDTDLSSDRQDENTLRATLGWDRSLRRTHLSAGAGYTHTDLLYVYKGDQGGELREMIHSQSRVNTFSGYGNAEYTLSPAWLLTGGVTAYQHLVRSVDRAVVSADGQRQDTGYDQSRLELSALATARWKPIGGRWGLSAQLRGELCGRAASPPIIAGFAEYLLSHRGNITLKTSATRNYRFPTLNDLYFQPGGNPNLKPEKGFSYDGGVAAHLQKRWLDVSGEATGYDSYIDDWILWRGTSKGFWTPVNIARVHSYGAELKGRLTAKWGRQWQLDLDGNFTLSRAINLGGAVDANDLSVGKQLVYIPKYSAAVSGRLGWRAWAFAYKFCHYGERYTDTGNDAGWNNTLPPYYMSDISLEKRFAPRWARITLKLLVNNLFDEQYESVLRRPMAGRNYGFLVEIDPKTVRR